MVDNLGLKNELVLTGFVSDQDLLTLYAISSLFIFPSLYEGFGLPPLEAMAAGLPVVSSNTSAMPEVLGEAALTFDPKQSFQATQAMLSILQNKELALGLRAKGRAQAAKFNWENTAQKTVQVYKQVLRIGGERTNKTTSRAENT